MSLGKIKVFLTLLMAVGAVAYFGGDGTLASFSAETTNANSTIASGTLTMSNTVNSGTVCLSSAGTNNLNPNCTALFTLTNVAPGVFGGVARITVQNTGSINASKFTLFAPAVTPTVANPGISNGASVSSIPVTALAAAVYKGQPVVLTNGSSQSQTFYASAGAAANATSISVTSQTASYAFATGSNVDVRDCYDQFTTSSPVAGATFGNLGFNTTTANPLCGALLTYVQEISQGTGDATSAATSSYSYCWVGYAPTNGMCYAPLSMVLSSAISGTVTSLPVQVSSTNTSTALDGNIKAGDLLVVTNTTTGATQQFTAGASNQYIGQTAAITVTSTGSVASFPIGSTVTDLSTDVNGPLQKLNGAAPATYSVSAFDQTHDASVAPIELAPVASTGTLSTTWTSELAAGTSRTFYIGVYLQAPTSSVQNNLQALFSTLGFTWHINQ